MKKPKSQGLEKEAKTLDTPTAPSCDDQGILNLFGINENIVESFNVSHAVDGVHISIKLIKCEQSCPTCGTKTTIVVSYNKKHIIHSVIKTNKCIIDYNARRFKCPACNKTFYESNPFTFGKERVSAATVYCVLTDLKDPSNTFKSVADAYHISQSTCVNIFDRYVVTPRLELPVVLSIDEVFIPTDNGNKYLCILLDFKTMKIVDVLPSRHKNELIDYFSKIPLEERNKVKIMSSDMWVTYHDVTKSFLRDCQRSIDKFHVLMEFSRKFTTIRCRVMKKYGSIKNYYIKEKLLRELTPEEKEEYQDACIKYYALKKFNWLFFKYNSNKKTLDPNREKKYNSVFKRYMNFYDIFEYMNSCDEELEEACNLKYELDIFYSDCDIDNAKENLEKLIIEFKESSIDEMRKFSGTLAGWKNEIINSFLVVDDGHINNGRIECVNKTIKTLKRNANGYTNFERLRRRIMWCVNKNGVLDMSSKEATKD